ncbi:8044_t:CDS:10 [Ambispora leptoticha]|uniref:Peptidyl-prolyl isomerase CWC27 n=1 Tax=Ambispora leptoticha TaxID=144679 RepID=A0A9N8V8G4_9GLOM|nr:8044_t:CDS:10 [Ambispora leptoticha]
MSNLYIQEPPTSGKVVLHTTAGDIDIELWSKEAPKATRNFIQLCLEGYYTGTIFHRVVPQFIIQGGDPTGTGEGGDSIYEAPFPDEFHTRLRFVRRGLVAMANAGRNDNRSQFFITLNATEELQNKHTIFGKVVGDTIFNVLKIGELEVDADERPFYPPSILSTEVLANPFDDIVPRVSLRERQAQEVLIFISYRNIALLSFGEEATEIDSTGDLNLKIKSSHDLIDDDPRLSKEPAVNMSEITQKETQKLETTKKRIHGTIENTEDNEDESPEDFDRKMKANVKQMVENMQKESMSKDKNQHLSKSEIIRQEIQQVTQDIKKLNKSKDTNISQEDRPKKKSKLESNFLETERTRYLKSGKAAIARRKKGSEEDTLAKLRAFQHKIDTAPPENPLVDQETVNGSDEPCTLHSVPNCQSCRDTFGQSQNDLTDEGWLSHQLVFEKDHKGKDLMQRRDDPDDFIVIDPLARKQQAFEEEKKKRAQKSGKISEVFTQSSSSSHQREREPNPGGIEIVTGVQDEDKIILWVGYSQIASLAYGVYLTYFKKELVERQRNFKRDILSIKQELGRTSSQDQFSKWAKLRRKMDSKMNDLDKLSKSLGFLKTSFEVKFTTSLWLFTNGIQVVMMIWYRTSPVFYLPKDWFSPVTWMFSLPLAPSGSVSVTMWFIICRKVLRKLVGTSKEIRQLYLKYAPDQVKEHVSKLSSVAIDWIRLQIKATVAKVMSAKVEKTATQTPTKVITQSSSTVNPSSVGLTTGEKAGTSKNRTNSSNIFYNKKFEAIPEIESETTVHHNNNNT